MPFDKAFVPQDKDPTIDATDRLRAIGNLLGIRFAVIAGAGISYGAGLPLASAIAEHLLNSIGA